MVSRLIDPRQHIERAVDEQHGVITQREMGRRAEQTLKTDAQSDRTQRLITFETIDLYNFNILANTDTYLYPMFVTASTTMALGAYLHNVAEQCRICVIRIRAMGFVSAGTCTPFVQVEEDGALENEYLFDECVVDTAALGAASARFDWNIAPQVAKGAVWKFGLRTDAAFLPTTLDFQGSITFAYEQWV